VEDEIGSIRQTPERVVVLGPPFMNINEHSVGSLVNEHSDGSLASSGWLDVDFDDSQWTLAVPTYSKVFMMPILPPWPLAPRPIPLFTENLQQFDRALKTRGDVSLDQWNDFLNRNQSINIPRNSHQVVELQSKVLTTGFLQLATQHGRGAVIEITCAESYEKDLHLTGPSPRPMQRFKGDRADSSGELYGPIDTYAVGGDGYYEPFWFRTFRYIRLDISTRDQALSLLSFDYRETHYPLDIGTEISRTPELDGMWKNQPQHSAQLHARNVRRLPILRTKSVCDGCSSANLVHVPALEGRSIGAKDDARVLRESTGGRID
jgi:alpha-L-rhamnosidase